MNKPLQVLTLDKGNTMNTKRKKNIVIRKVVLALILITAPSFAGAFPVYPYGSLGSAQVEGGAVWQSALCSSPMGCATGLVSGTINGFAFSGSAGAGAAPNTADLAVIATMSGGDYSIGASSDASISDTLHFYGAFAPDARAVFTMTATGGIAGSVANYPYTLPLAQISFNGYYSDTGGGSATIWTNVISSNCFNDANGVVRCMSSDGTNLSISMDFPLSSLLPNGFNFWMSLSCGVHGDMSGSISSCSYKDPFTITLPAGVTFTSASGQFLTAPVPVPAAVWLFGSGLLGLIGVARRKTRAA